MEALTLLGERISNDPACAIYTRMRIYFSHFLSVLFFENVRNDFLSLVTSEIPLKRGRTGAFSLITHDGYPRRGNEALWNFPNAQRTYNDPKELKRDGAERNLPHLQGHLCRVLSFAKERGEWIFVCESVWERAREWEREKGRERDEESLWCYEKCHVGGVHIRVLCRAAFIIRICGEGASCTQTWGCS